jgi:hypothetical protein
MFPKAMIPSAWSPTSDGCTACELRRAWQRKLEALLQVRTPLTKVQAVRQLAVSAPRRAARAESPAQARLRERML